jgi:hypothetical protein
MGQIVAVPIGIGIFLIGYFQMRKSRKAASWPSTVGTIRKAEIYREQSTDYESTSASLGVRVKYTFQASGQQHVGKRIRFDNVLYATNKQAQKALEDYPIGKPVQVFFDPQNPDNCVLQKKNTTGAMLLIVGAIIAIIGLAGLLA